MSTVLIMIGGGVGAVLRYFAARVAPALPPKFPWVLALVNTSGAFFVLLVSNYASGVWHDVLITGVLGGFTTFSAASADAASLWQTGRRTQALWRGAALFACTMVGAWLGWLISAR